ncbi:SpoIIE family protein phosphatase [Microbulbifer sp.]|uniref:SpoIIE family protein phosphatase n=1 Tax=Microbulbifer sp. TaxID=1908541 RepID=UPI003F36832B
MSTKRPATADAAGAENNTRRTRPTFLVVDDDPMLRKIVARGLAALDPAEILEVEDGLAAQDVLSAKNVDVVVTDVLMPHMNGLELMKWAQEHCPGPLWIVLSGLETFDAAVDALQLGAFDYLGKPPEVQRVRVVVRNALDQIELVRERKRLYGQIARSNAQLAENVEQLQQACRMLEEQAAVIQSDLDRAEVIQRALLPQEPPEIDGWCLETLYRSGSSVGGDLYDVILLHQKYMGVVIADAAGHGVAAAMLSVLLKLRLNLTDKAGLLRMPGQVLSDLNRRLYETVTAPGAFITAMYVLLNRNTGQAWIASAGHPPCIWTTPAGQCQLLAHTGPALGLEADARYEEREVQLAVGDRLLLYTDGVLGSGAESITSDDLTRTLRSGIDRAELPGTLYRTATQKITGERDDITLILLERGEGVSHFDHTASPEGRLTPQPSTTQAQLMYAVRGEQAFISIAGNVTWVFSQALLDIANTLLERHNKLTIDLAACEYMDSTCLGTLHEIVISRPDAVYLQRMPANIRELFEELSMGAVLSHESPSIDPLPDLMEPLPRREVGVAQQCARILSAHETLASLSPENREKFQGVVDSLREDPDRNR